MVNALQQVLVGGKWICFGCDREGHFNRELPNKTKGSSSASARDGAHRTSCPCCKKSQSPGGVFKLSQGPAPLNKRKRVVKAHWTVPLITGLRPKMALTIGDRTFRFLIDTGANHTIIRKDKPPLLLGVGRQSTSWETRLPWTDPDGNRWEVHSLVVSGLTVNVLGQDIRRETDA